MGALTGVEAAERANATAEANRQSAMRSYGLNAYARSERQKIMTTQTHTALMSQQTRHMYSTAKAIGTTKARAAAAGRSSDDAGMTQIVSAMKAVFDFEGRVAGENIRDQRIRMDSGMAAERMRSSEQLTGQLNAAKSQERDVGNALMAGIFQDVGMAVSMVGSFV